LIFGLVTGYAIGNLAPLINFRSPSKPPTIGDVPNTSTSTPNTDTHAR